MPVQLRLAAEEIVQVILPAPRIPGPGRAAEHRLPVGRRRAVGLGIGPDIPVRLRVIATGAAFDEPGVLVRSVRIDLVNQDLEAEFVRAGDQRVEIGERAEDRIDIAIIADVVAEILHRTGEERRDPDRIDAERGDMVEPPGDTRKVADPVAIRIHEAARIDLVDRRAAPPFDRRVGVRCACGLAQARHQSAPNSQTAQPKAGMVSCTLPGAVGVAGHSPDRDVSMRVP